MDLFSKSHAGSSIAHRSSRDTRRARFLATASSRASGKALSDSGLADDNGEHVPMTLEENLISRFDPHGIRRQVRSSSSSSPITTTTVGYEDSSHTTVVASISSAATATNEEEEDDEEGTLNSPHEICYFCVACEVEVAKVDDEKGGGGGGGRRRGTPTMATVQAVYLHCGSAVHRRAIRFMALEETDAALTLPINIDPDSYRTIFVNGLRTLVCHLPFGGGILFNKVYHNGEQQNQSPVDVVAEEEEEGPGDDGSGSNEVSAAKRRRLQNKSTRCRVHFPRQTFFTESWIRQASAWDAPRRPRKKKENITAEGVQQDDDGGGVGAHRRSSADSSLINYSYVRIPLRLCREAVDLTWEELVVQEDRKRIREGADLITRSYLPAGGEGGEPPRTLSHAHDHVGVHDGGVYRLALKVVTRESTRKRMRREKQEQQKQVLLLQQQQQQQPAMSQLTEEALRIHSQREAPPRRLSGGTLPRVVSIASGDKTDNFSHDYSSSSGGSSLAS